MKSIIVLLCIGLTFAVKARYDNYHVFRVIPEDLTQLNVLRELENQNSGYIFWETPNFIGRFADFVVPPHKLAEIDIILAKFGMEYTTLTTNLQEWIDNEGIAPRKRAAFDWNEYHNLPTMYKWMDDIAAQYPNIVTKFNVGKTYEGRDILGLKISYKDGNEGIFVKGNIHAREWITSATATWILNELLTSTDPNVRDIAENIDWYIVPVVNPDGFQYSHTSDRMWRKNRKPSSSFCHGADINRNFGFKWMAMGASGNPCHEAYAGSSEFSEPETVALAAFYSSIAENITAYIDFHSFGQFLMYPYGTSGAGDISNRKEHIKVGKAMQNKIAERYGTKYVFGNLAETLYEASGCAIDWVKGVYDTPFVFVIEMRDTGTYGFMLPADQIVPNAEEILDSLVTMVQEARKLGYFDQNNN
ncbi:zinc carboxypeptidase-like [Culicoides brevitarsis]|uniref:zinc carboxypeptidase-like n=1 Tax=Culicoides brevitarsis TaxID=469753 RepID=UPI00307B59BA